MRKFKWQLSHHTQHLAHVTFSLTVYPNLLQKLHGVLSSSEARIPKLIIPVRKTFRLGKAYSCPLVRWWDCLGVPWYLWYFSFIYFYLLCFYSPGDVSNIPRLLSVTKFSYHWFTTNLKVNTEQRISRVQEGTNSILQ